MDKSELVRLAVQSAKAAYAPYSHFMVGAALLCEDGRVYLGCNIENASFTPTCCAERAAFIKAVSEGERKFSKIAVAGGRDGVISEFCPPCGVCRQVMAEFCDPDKFTVLLTDGNDIREYKLASLLPMSFGGNFI